MEETYKGKIEKNIIGKMYGFIKGEDGNNYFFLFGRNERKEIFNRSNLSTNHVIYAGDNVTFKLKPSDLDQSKLIAYDLCFDGGSNKDGILEKCEKQGHLIGRLKLIGNNLYVKHFETNMIIFVRTSKWEVELDDVYIENVERVVKFKVFKEEKTNALYANLVERRFCQEYNMAMEAMEKNTILDARVLSRNRMGIYVQIFDDTEAFVSFPTNLSQRIRKELSKEIIPVKIKKIMETRHIYLELA